MIASSLGIGECDLSPLGLKKGIGASAILNVLNCQYLDRDAVLISPTNTLCGAICQHQQHILFKTRYFAVFPTNIYISASVQMKTMIVIDISLPGEKILSRKKFCKN
jgi:hypothetical protein